MHGEGGQGTVEWVALVLVAALVLVGAGALAASEADPGLGKELAKRIARTARERPLAAAASSPVRKRPISGRFRPTSDGPLRGEATRPPRDARPRAAAPRAVDALRGVRGFADVAKHAWIVCLGYERWRHELEHPLAPNEPLPVDVAVSIVNTCFNPHDYLVEEE